MKKIISRLLVPFLILMTVAVPLAMPASNVGAVNLFPACNAAGSNNTTVCQNKGDDVGGLIQTVVNILLYILAAIAVIMIIVGGIRYTTSNGEAAGIKSAKDTIVYAVIGLVVAMLAWAIVNFVIKMF
ncbi:MAG: hypothetical protein JWM00_125 [Candidatus Saccharibacteria bacterium]|nr:hypothetical protein [Candidatus Saccharibacteria bacterium]